MKKRGIGVASMIYGIGYGFSRPDIASATLEICEDGSVILRSGEVDFGQGSDTVACQIVAEELGIPPDTIQLISADTLHAPNAGPSSASRLTYVMGNAVLKAARAIKETMARLARDILGEEELVFVDSEIRGEQPGKSMSFQELARECHHRGMQIVETAWHNNTTGDLDPETSQGDGFSTYAYATQMVEVEVDTETGRVEVLRVLAAHDVGKAINPACVEAQVEGGVAMGLGYALTEEVKHRAGHVETRSLGEYMMPTSLDVPAIEIHIVEEGSPQGPYGAKGVGEPALIPTAPAILNAIADALDVRVTDLPADPENIHRLIRAQGAGKSR